MGRQHLMKICGSSSRGPKSPRDRISRRATMIALVGKRMLHQIDGEIRKLKLIKTRTRMQMGKKENRMKPYRLIT